MVLIERGMWRDEKAATPLDRMAVMRIQKFELDTVTP